MAGNKKRLWPVLAALAGAAALCFGLLRYGRSAGWFLPGWVRWESRVCFDGEDGVEIRLEKKQVRLFAGGICFWTSPPEIRVQDALSCDIDGDGAQELLLLCWKQGRFGSSRPFWIESDETDWSQHLFVYEYDRESVRAQWMSSYMGVDAAELSAEELSGGRQPAWGLRIADPDGNVSRWVWDSWGFTRTDAPGGG